MHLIEREDGESLCALMQQLYELRMLGVDMNAATRPRRLNEERRLWIPRRAIRSVDSMDIVCSRQVSKQRGQ